MASSPSSQQVISRIAALARAGRMDEAAIQIVGAMAGPAASDPALAALGGAVEFHRGQFERAATYLRDAHRAFPADLTIRANLAESLYRTGRNEDAAALCDESSARADRTSRIARLGAYLAQESGDFDRAIALHRLLVDRDAGDWSAWNNLGNAYGGAGRHDDAAQALEKAAALSPDSPPIRLNLGNALLDAERYDEAQKVFQDLAAEFPEDAHPQQALYGFYRRAGMEEAALAAIREAVRRNPADPESQNEYGHEASRSNRHAEAEQAFAAALSIDPALSGAYVGLASLLERVNREDELDGLRDRAASHCSDPEPVGYIDALRFRRAGRFDEALAALDSLGEEIVSLRHLHMRGSVLDRLGRHDEAFATFQTMNEQTKDDPERPLERARVYREHVSQGLELTTSEWRDSWRKAEIAPADWTDPVILLGFPRSGTTLLDTMLMAVPGTAVLEEEKFIADLERELGGIEALPGLSDSDIADARARYFERVSKAVDLKPGMTIVDKHPLHLNKVPVLQRLFPKARYILALRHPCDVLLSCYITNFRANHAMSNFLDLDTAAWLYDTTFTYWEKARDVFGLDVQTVVYERLVEDTARELQPVFAALGLPWPEGGMDHREAARDRGVVRTASYAQVTEPIYTRSAGRWQRYAEHLAPIFPVVKPWVEKFGYSLEDGRIPPWPAP